MKPVPILYSVRASARFSSREIVGWLGMSWPLSGARSQAISRAGSVTQRVEIVGVLVAGCDRHHARRHHRAVAVDDEQLVARIGERIGDCAGKAETPCRFAQYDEAPIRREVACILRGCERLPRDG